LATHQKKAQRLNAHLVFLDETGLSLIPNVARTWAPRGCTPILRHPQRGWTKLNQIAAITVSPQRRRLNLYWHWQRGKAADTATIVEFLGQLLRHLRGHIIVVLDNLPSHRSSLVRQLLRKHPRLHLEYLPSYAPELNPCELLFAHQKRPLANHAMPDLDCLFDHADDHLQGLRHQQYLLRGFIDGTPLKLKWST
jgi:hypothetical protein